MKRSATATVRRTVRRAVTWRPKTRPDEPVDIDQLISPLRYDVLVRAQVFDLVTAMGEAAYTDTDELVAAARESSYWVWFRDVAMARFRPWVLKDPEVLEQQFRERVESAAVLHRSFRARGFDPAHPVTLRGCHAAVATDSGLRVNRRLHVGDGGHRTALLLSAGQQLHPGMYRVDWRPMPQLIDNTAVLLPALGVEPAAYISFLARGYGVTTSDLDVLLSELETRHDGSAAEAREVAARHLGAALPLDGATS